MSGGTCFQLSSGANKCESTLVSGVIRANVNVGPEICIVLCFVFVDAPRSEGRSSDEERYERITYSQSPQAKAVVLETLSLAQEKFPW